MSKPRKLTNTSIKIDRVLAKEFDLEYEISGQKKREAMEEAMRDYIAKKKAARK